MGIRIQPIDIIVPEDDPFCNDLLDRKDSIEVLTHLLGSIEGPCVMAVDAGWGNGKTTFRRIWSQHLRNEGYPVVEINAWETDFSDDPFLALATELTNSLKYQSENSTVEKIDEAKKCAAEVMRRALPGLIRIGTAGILDIQPLLNEEIGNALASYAECRLSAYQESKDSVEKFKQALQEMATNISQSNGDFPVVVMIDELDRCRPSYAVELLEVAKHLFLAEHIIFVLSINRAQLAHSIKALYGKDFDAQGYLRRFVDVDFQLPAPKRNDFIRSTLLATDISKYLERTQDNYSSQDFSFLQDMFTSFFLDSNLNLRQISQAIHHFGLVIGSLRSDHRSFMLTAVVALILRAVDADLYYRYLDGEVADIEVSDTIFRRSGLGPTRNQHAGHLFEAVLIIGNHEISRALSADRTPVDSPLLNYKKEILEATGDDEANQDRSNAEAVIRLVETFFREDYIDRGVGFMQSVQRI